MKNRIVSAILVAIIACIFVGLAIIKLPKKEVAPVLENKITIVTSFYPLADFAQKIAGNKAEVINITPAGSEPHEYEPTPKDLALIYDSKLFIYNGINLEGWVDKIIPDLINSNVKVVKASEGINTIGEGIKSDPHIWLDPVLAQQMVVNIRNGLIAIDPENTNHYMQNADQLIVNLISLDQKYKTTIFNCDQKDIVTSHEAFAYLSKRYGFLDFSISGMNPDEEPSPQKLSELVNLVKEKKVKYILTETLVSPKFADTIAKEAGVTTLSFNTIEGLTPDELAKGEEYFSIQEQNITNLKLALECPNL